MRNLIDTPKMVVVSPFGRRIREGKEEFHKGIDLRSWNKIIWTRLPVIAHEPLEILRIWHDGWGTGFAVRPTVSDYDEFKYIHIQPTAAVKEGAILKPGTIIGVSQNLKWRKRWREHIHFETWRSGVALDPVIFLDEAGMIFKGA